MPEKLSDPSPDASMVTSRIPVAPALLTIGHSNHTTDGLVALLKRYEVELLADVRSQPSSTYAFQFNEPQLRADLTARGLRYVFLGHQLGGRPQGDGYYDDDGYVRYDVLAESAEFLAGIKRLERELAERAVAILCSEEDPAVCHRRLLVSRVLASRGIESLHIRGDGRLQTEAEIAADEERRKLGNQRTLFAVDEAPPWRSLRSVLPKRRQPTFSTD